MVGFDVDTLKEFKRAYIFQDNSMSLFCLPWLSLLSSLSVRLFPPFSFCPLMCPLSPDSYTFIFSCYFVLQWQTQRGLQPHTNLNQQKTFILMSQKHSKDPFISYRNVTQNFTGQFSDNTNLLRTITSHHRQLLFPLLPICQKSL